MVASVAGDHHIQIHLRSIFVHVDFPNYFWGRLAHLAVPNLMPERYDQ